MASHVHWNLMPLAYHKLMSGSGNLTNHKLDWDIFNSISMGSYHSLSSIVDMQYFLWLLIIDDTWNLMPQTGCNKLQWEMLFSICSHEEFAWGQSLLKQLLSLPTNCLFICCTNHDIVAPTDLIYLLYCTYFCGSLLLYQLLLYLLFKT